MLLVMTSVYLLTTHPTYLFKGDIKKTKKTAKCGRKMTNIHGKLERLLIFSVLSQSDLLNNRLDKVIDQFAF